MEEALINIRIRRVSGSKCLCLLEPMTQLERETSHGEAALGPTQLVKLSQGGDGLQGEGKDFLMPFYGQICRSLCILRQRVTRWEQYLERLI